MNVYCFKKANCATDIVERNETAKCDIVLICPYIDLIRYFDEIIIGIT